MIMRTRGVKIPTCADSSAYTENSEKYARLEICHWSPVIEGEGNQ